MASPPSSIQALAEAINGAAPGRPCGQLQTIRQRLRGTSRTATKAIFAQSSIHDNYAFHSGGRSELQFNIGYEGETFRYGVAFSLEPSRSFPDVSVLFPRIARFNDYLRTTPRIAVDLWMRHSIDMESSKPYRPRPIPPELARPKVFVFLGARVPRSKIQVEQVLDIFDRLLPLYEYVESEAGLSPLISKPLVFQFTPGCSAKQDWASANLAQRSLNIDLRHNRMQQILHDELVREHGAGNVGAENPSGTGGRVDIVVRVGKQFRFYEIKTALTARACIREALPQLLEYSLWPGSQEAKQLVVVGTPTLDQESAGYLNRLRERFGIPILYRALSIQSILEHGDA